MTTRLRPECIDGDANDPCPSLVMDRKGLRESFDKLRETVEKLMPALPQGAKDE